MTIEEVYEHYSIMPLLRLHMYRVAGVALLICQSLNKPLDATSIIRAALLHDMGNIIRFDLEKLPESLKPEGLLYWTGVKRQYVQDYGTDEHKASLAIARQLGVSVYVLDLIDAIGFSKARDAFLSQDLGRCILCYSDQRVTPQMVTDIKERTEEGKKRYEGRASYDFSVFDEMVSQLYNIERFIFMQSSIDPQTITDESVSQIVPTLRTVEI